MRTIQIEKVLKEADYVLKDNLQLLKMFMTCLRNLLYFFLFKNQFYCHNLINKSDYIS